MTVLDSTFLVDLSRTNPAAVKRLRDLVARGRPLRVPTAVLMEVAAGTQDPVAAARSISESFLVASFDEETAVVAAGIGRDLLGSGQFPGWIDIAIAATAVRYDEELVTRDERHFRRISSLKVVTY